MSGKRIFKALLIYESEHGMRTDERNIVAEEWSTALRIVNRNLQERRHNMSLDRITINDMGEVEE